MRLTPEKGLEYLVEAANRLPQITQVVIAGASDHDSAYRNRLEQLDVNHKVIFTGFTTGEDLRQLYSHARCFVLPSVNEGFPMVLLEAIAYGLPILCSDIPGTRQVDLRTTSPSRTLIRFVPQFHACSTLPASLNTTTWKNTIGSQSLLLPAVNIPSNRPTATGARLFCGG